MGNTVSGEFGASTVGQEVVDKFADKCINKIIIVTGGNTGLGFETARCLASKGATVVLACRNSNLGESAAQKIKSQVSNSNVSFICLDLGSLKSVKEFASQFQSKFKRLDILINNAGVMACPKSATLDGIEMQFGVNHIGHFYLTQLLLPILIKTGTPDSPARVVNLSSVGQYLFGPAEGIRFNDINGDEDYNSWERYGQSKLCNVLFSKELNSRYESKNVISISLHPGIIAATELMRHLFTLSNITSVSKDGLKGVWSLLTPQKLAIVSSQRLKSIPEGVSTTLVAALDPDIVAGGYYYDCKLSQGEGLHPAAHDIEMAIKLWEVSESIISDLSKKTATKVLKVRIAKPLSGIKFLLLLLLGLFASFAGYWILIKYKFVK
jgi:retinol dehydrogenase-12/retinol dehydrogenase-13